MAEKPIEMIAPQRGNRCPENETQHARVLRRYARRGTVEPTIGREKSTRLFQARLYLECALLLLKEVSG